MKILTIIITGFIITVHTHCCGQNFDEWFRQKETQKEYLVQQIAALKVYLGHLKKGYEIAKQGLTIIGDISEGNFNLHEVYFSSLDAVNPSVRNNSKISFILEMHQLIQESIHTLSQQAHDDDNLTIGEVRYLSKVYDNLLKACDGFIEDLTHVTTDDDLQMNDRERIDRIDNIFGEIQSLYAFTRDFGNSVILLSLQRSGESSAIFSVRQYYNVQLQE